MIFEGNNLPTQVILQNSTANFVWSKFDKELMGTEKYDFYYVRLIFHQLAQNI